VRIIQGKGIGVQREIVWSVLSRTPFIRDWTTAPSDAGGRRNYYAPHSRRNSFLVFFRHLQVFFELLRAKQSPFDHETNAVLNRKETLLYVLRIPAFDNYCVIDKICKESPGPQ
jgi:hypothetical protein